MLFGGKCGLDDKIMPNDWLNAILKISPIDNLEDIPDVDVMGDMKKKSCLDNWDIYSSTKAKMCNAGEPGHIYIGQY